MVTSHHYIFINVCIKVISLKLNEEFFVEHTGVFLVFYCNCIFISWFILQQKCFALCVMRRTSNLFVIPKYENYWLVVHSIRVFFLSICATSYSYIHLGNAHKIFFSPGIWILLLMVNWYGF